MSRTYTVTLEVEVKMTSRGYPAIAPTFSSPGEPPEGPEFEIETISIDGNETVKEKYKKYKAALPPNGYVASFDQFFADAIYDAVLDRAADDDWSDESYTEYEPRED